MSRRALRFAEAAIIEAEEAADWYAERSVQARDDFLQELRRAFEQIAEAPERWPSHLFATRRFVLHRFPFDVVYRLVGDEVPQVLAIAHHKRRPGYWRRR